VDLADAIIKANPPLKELNLGHNMIGDKGAIALADILHFHA
jgi:hypothetical protein